MFLTRDAWLGPLRQLQAGEEPQEGNDCSGEILLNSPVLCPLGHEEKNEQIQHLEALMMKGSRKKR